MKRKKNHLPDLDSLQIIINAAPVAMLLLNEALEIVLLNDIARENLRRDTQEMHKQAWGQAILCTNASMHPMGCGYSQLCRDCILRNALIQTFEEQESVRGLEIELSLALEGTPEQKWFSINTECLHVAKDRYVIMAMYDVTHQKTAESELMALNEALEIQNRALDKSRKAAVKLMENEITSKQELEKLNKILGMQNRALVESRVAALRNMEQAKKAKNETEALNRKLKESIEHANRMAEEAERANRFKSEFLANTSHEIRTPMNAILGFGDVLSREKLTPRQREYLNIIREAGNNLLALINDILDYSKIEAGKFTVEKIQTPVLKILGQVDVMLRPAALQKGLSFEVVFDTPVPAEIITDPIRLRQCLVNLINNAIKFTEQGHIRIKVGLPDEKKIHFRIEDTGIGIAKEKHEMVFQTFTQADGSTTRKYGGTGLGLSITRKIVEKLGGRVLLNSEPGRGSCFTIEVPVGLDTQNSEWIDQYKEESECIMSDDTNFSPLNGHILVVEDNPSNQALINVLLKRMNLTLDIADDGCQALDKVSKTTYDAILMDMQMPNMNGYEATAAMRKKGIKTPIIALTANAMSGDAEKCLQAGCDSYLSKPVKQQILYETLREYLEKDSENSPAEKPGKNTSALNPDIVSEIESDSELIKVVELFVEDIPDTLRRFQDCIDRGNIDQFRQLTHQYKGASGSAGFSVLCEKLSKLETEIQDHGMASIDTFVNQIKDISERIHARFNPNSA